MSLGSVSCFGGSWRSDLGCVWGEWWRLRDKGFFLFFWSLCIYVSEATATSWTISSFPHTSNVIPFFLCPYFRRQISGIPYLRVSTNSSHLSFCIFSQPSLAKISIFFPWTPCERRKKKINKVRGLKWEGKDKYSPGRNSPRSARYMKECLFPSGLTRLLPVPFPPRLKGNGFERY